MGKLPEGRKPLLWKDIPFADRPKAHPSTERLEIEKLEERVAELEARIAKADALADALSFYAAATVEYPNGKITFQPGDDSGQRAQAALATYREGSDT